MSLALLAASLMLNAAEAGTKLVNIVSIPHSVPEDLAWDGIVMEIRIEGNKHTREDVIRRTFKSQVGHPYTQENARLDLL